MYPNSIKTARLVLRPTTEADAERAFQIQNDWDTVRMLRMAEYPPTRNNMYAWFKEHENERVEGTAHRFAMELNGYVIGIADIDEIEGTSGEIGYWLDRAYWGKGYASEAAQALVEYAFETLGLTKLSTGHAIDNPASGKILRKLGFRETRRVSVEYPVRGDCVVHQFYKIDRGYT